MKTMKFIKIILIVLLIAFIVFLELNVTGDRQVKDIYNDLSSAITDKNRNLGDQNKLKKYYDINIDELEDFILYFPSNSQSASELLILKVKNKDSINGIKEKIEKRLLNQKTAFKGYNADNSEILENAEVYYSGKYALFAAGTDSKEIKAAFKKAIVK